MAQAGPTPADVEIANWLRQQTIPSLLAVNKCESPQQGITQAAQFWELALGEPYPLSAIHGNGTGELLEQLIDHLPVQTDGTDTPDVKVAIVGRPNVGKSSLLNAFCGGKPEPLSARSPVPPVMPLIRWFQQGWTDLSIYRYRWDSQEKER